MAKKKKTEGSVSTVKFTVPSFRYEGKEYKSADVEKAADEGDEEALAIVANLVKIGSGIVEVVGTEEPKEEKEEGNE